MILAGLEPLQLIDVEELEILETISAAGREPARHPAGAHCRPRASQHQPEELPHRQVSSRGRDRVPATGIPGDWRARETSILRRVVVVVGTVDAHSGTPEVTAARAPSPNGTDEPIPGRSLGSNSGELSRPSALGKVSR